MPEFPIALRWEVPENQLIPLKDSVDGLLSSSSVTNIPGLTYCLKMSPNGFTVEKRGKAWLFLWVDLGKLKKVEAAYTFTIESANHSFKTHYIFDKSIGWGASIADTVEFFNSEKNFIVAGKCVIKVFGTFKYGTEDSTLELPKWELGDLGDKVWMNTDTKDFTVVVGSEEIKVHKLILGSQSKVFSAMFKSNTKESVENKVVITDFTFDVVETAVKMIYNCSCVTSFSFDKSMDLLQFLDKYDIASLKDKVEHLLVNKISAATVCCLTNASILSNSTTLKSKCMEFLENSFASKTPLSDINILDNDVLKEVVQNMVLQNV